MKRFLTSLFLLATMFAGAQSTTLVISQVYGGGGNTGAPYNADYIELHNVSTSAISLSGYSVQYSSATGTTWTAAALPASSIPAGGYFLIQTTTVGTVGSALPTPDHVTATATPAVSLNMSGTAGKVALVNGVTALSGCPTAGSYVDLVAFGTTPTCFEGTGPTPAPSNTTAVLRANNGCTDTDNNSADFTAGTPAPRNSATAIYSCSGAAAPVLTPTPNTLTFTSTIVGTFSASQSVSLVGSNLTGAPGSITLTASNTDFQVSSDNTTFGATATIAYTSATLAATNFYVRFSPQSSGTKTGSIAVAGGGATSSVSLTGTAASLAAPVATAATSVGNNGFTANWNAVTGASGYYLDVYTQSAGLVTSTIAGWNCATAAATSQTADLGNANNIAIQTISLNGSTGTISWPSGPSGATGVPNPYSVSANGWDAGQDTKYWQVDVNTTGATGITVSSLQGSSSTGPKDFKVQYKVGAGGTWTDVTGGTVALTTAVTAGTLSTWGAITNLALPSAADNQALVSIRWIQTSNTAINGTTVVSTGTSRISAVYVKGQVNGMVNNYVLQNQSVGNVTSYNVTGLTPGTTYYYVVRAANAVTTSQNSNEISVTTTSTVPTITTGALTAFGNICTNTTAGPNSFTISGTNLTTADVTVAALAGYTYSTSSTGTYTSTLTLTQTGGTFSQTVYVKFAPTAVQSYSGNISISGGGLSAAVNIAASGAGINTMATVASGAASAITTSSATVAGTISANGCTSVTAYGIEYSTTSGFTSGTQAASTNISSGAYTSGLSGLAQGTTYYYKAYATNAGGTAYGTELSFTTLTPNPTITVTNPTAFGNACLNTTAGPNSFVISGTNLSTANVTVAALAGYTYSTTSTGTYTSTLSLTQTGGTYSQTIYVKFTPTAVQSYAGNISVAGGGVATAVNAAVSGAGINTAATVTSGAASAITTTTATVAGTVTATGCSAVTAYGIEYSTINGFANGAGTATASTNIASGAYTSALSGLAPSTVYYYHAYATNAGGTSYGAQQTFTTAAPPPPVLSVTGLASFGNVCTGSLVGPNTFIINGSNLTTALITVGPLAGYSFSETSTGSYNSAIGILQTGGTQTKTVYVKFNPLVVQSYNGNIPVVGGGAALVNVSAYGAGVNTLATITTGASSAVTTTTANLAGSFGTNGCSPITVYGIEYSGVSGFVGGTGIKVQAASGSTGNYTVDLSGLVQGTTYYYRAYGKTANGDISYGSVLSFTTVAIGTGFNLFPSPVYRGGSLWVTKDNLTPGYYGLLFYSANGQLAYQFNFNIQANFINQQVALPSSLAFGIYRVNLVNIAGVVDSKTILVQ
jgi:hypothetical protein